MTLPKKFKFTTECSDIIYKAQFDESYGMYIVKWKEVDNKMSMTYLSSIAHNYIMKGYWTLLPESFKGIQKACRKLNILISEIENLDSLSADECMALENTQQMISSLSENFE